MGGENWETRISEVKPNEIRLRGCRIDELMGAASFADAVWLAFTGDLPSPGVRRLIDAILVASIDHGVTPPSALAAMNAASTGASLSACVASGVLAINKWHGGAIEDAMEQFYAGVAEMEENGWNFNEAAAAFLDGLAEKGAKVMGYGHRIHTSDPRTAKIISLAVDAGLEGRYINLALAIEEELERRKGKKLPLNVDGAIAAALCEVGIPAGLANAFFIVARVPGLAAHAFEEMTTQKPMRKIDQSAAVYTGPPPRDLPDEFKK